MISRKSEEKNKIKKWTHSDIPYSYFSSTHTGPTKFQQLHRFQSVLFQMLIKKNSLEQPYIASNEVTYHC